MPAKYHIHTHHAPPRKKPIGKYGIIDWREDCSACHNCVKRECAYSVYKDENERLRSGPHPSPLLKGEGATVEYVDYLYECKGCLCCVQSCAKGLLSWDVNPEYLKMGDEVWTPDIISSTWYQAETGKIPVSGAGYPGPFRGPGFDSILTDMSEIVRPTRDGIHGREYISTSVDIGRKPMKLEFDQEGRLVTKCPPIVEIPIPVLFNSRPWQKLGGSISGIIADAARELGTFAITDDTTSVADLITVARLPFGPDAPSRAVELARSGIDAIHCFADWHGYANGQHVSLAIREVHQALVAEGIRDTITLIASGGIALAEQVIKSLLCGADLVAIDIPLVLALECRLCMNCRKELACPADVANVDPEYARQRIVNLMGAWHSQMLEMMGAMGIREARRLRGEIGRAMFFDDLERDCFGPVFGKRKAESGERRAGEEMRS